MKKDPAQAAMPKPKRRQQKPKPKMFDGRKRSTPLPMTPLIVEYGLYSTEQVLAALAISPGTLETWLADGLRSGKRNTQRRFFWGRDIIRFLVGEIDFLPDWQSSRQDAV